MHETHLKVQGGLDIRNLTLQVEKWRHGLNQTFNLNSKRAYEFKETINSKSTEYTENDSKTNLLSQGRDTIKVHSIS